MKQANFSTLLSQPMTWTTLSKTYKDRFLTMYMWLNDVDRMDKLNEQPKNDLNSSIASKAKTLTMGKALFSCVFVSTRLEIHRKKELIYRFL
jgi:hypothetical protein